MFIIFLELKGFVEWLQWNELGLDLGCFQWLVLFLCNVMQYIVGYFGSDVKVVYQLVIWLLVYESVQWGFGLFVMQDVYFIENLLWVGSVFLDVVNKWYWELIQQIEGGIVWLFQYYEVYVSVLVQNMWYIYLSFFIIVIFNIVIFVVCLDKGNFVGVKLFCYEVLCGEWFLDFEIMVILFEFVFREMFFVVRFVGFGEFQELEELVW